MIILAVVQFMMIQADKCFIEWIFDIIKKSSKQFIVLDVYPRFLFYNEGSIVFLSTPYIDFGRFNNDRRSLKKLPITSVNLKLYY